MELERPALREPLLSDDRGVRKGTDISHDGGVVDLRTGPQRRKKSNTLSSRKKKSKKKRKGEEDCYVALEDYHAYSVDNDGGMSHDLQLELSSDPLADGDYQPGQAVGNYEPVLIPLDHRGGEGAFSGKFKHVAPISGRMATSESGAAGTSRRKKKKKKRKREKRKAQRRPRSDAKKCCCCWFSRERAGGVRIIQLVVSLVMMAGAVYLDRIIQGSPHILMDDPNTPDTEKFDVTVSEFRLRRNDIYLEIPSMSTKNGSNKIVKEVSYKLCNEYDHICAMLARNGLIWLITLPISGFFCIVGALLQTCTKKRKLMRVSSVLGWLALTTAIGFWWGEAYFTLTNTDTAKFPFNDEDGTQNILELTFTKKKLMPGWSLFFASTAWFALTGDMLLALFVI